MKKSQVLATMMMLIAFPASLMAHEGHGHTTGNSPLHYVIEPYHALVFLVVVAAIAGIIYRSRKQPRKQ